MRKTLLIFMPVMWKRFSSDGEKRESRRLQQYVNLLVEKTNKNVFYFLKVTVTNKMVVDLILILNKHQGSVEEPSSKRMFPTLSSSINKNCTVYPVWVVAWISSCSYQASMLQIKQQNIVAVH